ncbi:MAG: low-specificity L-threonine aldolase [Myxococcales bacterium]|nr:low-specificity L-threonine aldolase [Myxococcales bacterium]HIK83764.1 low-specificity L-threonine aldolase [Myxococcales bacterium]
MIDLRSDTLTQPTEEMRAVMSAAAVGDDVYGEDPTVNALEEFTSDLLGFPAGMFAVSGTQANLCGIMAHCQRGDEYLVGQTAHTYKFEGGGAAVLGSIQPQPIEMSSAGVMDLAAIDAAIKRQPSMNHFALSTLLCLENTYSGRVLPADYVASAQELARSHGLRVHLDGARLWNAAVASGRSPAEIAQGFDSVSVCLSKGLGAPVGSVLVGSVDLIAEARRWRKMLGGGLRQAGILAAAGRYAIEKHVDRLSVDHANAARLAKGLSEIPGVAVDGPFTNMVFVEFEGAAPKEVEAKLLSASIKIAAAVSTRLICHLDISTDDVDRVLAAFRSALR